MQPSDPGLFLVLDHEDRVEQAHALHRLRLEDSGSLIVEVGPNPASLRELGHYILGALGKDSDLSGTGRNSGETWSYCQLWLTVEPVDRLIVTRAHNLRGSMIAELIELAMSCQLELWLIAQVEVLTRGQALVVSEWPIESVSADAFRERWEIRAAVRGSAQVTLAEPPDSPDSRRLPSLPLDDFMTFRAACHDLLAPEDFALADRLWKDAFRETAGWLAEVGAPDERTVSDYLRTLIESCTTFYEAMLPVRAAQAALFVGGWLVRTDLQVLASRLDVAPRTLDTAAAETLRAYVRPRITCAATILLSGNLQVADIIKLNVGDVRNGGQVVDSAAGEIAIPSHAAPLVDALVLERRLGGASDTDPLFVSTPQMRTKYTITRSDVPALRLQLRRVETETALMLVTRGKRSGKDDAVAWERRHGVMIVKL